MARTETDPKILYAGCDDENPHFWVAYLAEALARNAAGRAGRTESRNAVRALLSSRYPLVAELAVGWKAMVEEEGT